MSSPGNREVAHRLFAAEFEDADYSYSESDEERAPNYVVSPTGARINRLFVVGVLTEVSQAGESILRARVVDPTGAFVVYAGQYQPEAMAFLDRTTPPAFVAVTGKARTFQPEDSDIVYTSVRPESISEVDADTRDRWTVTAAERTLERIGTVAAALDTGLTGDALREALVQSGVDESLATGIPIALERYGTTRAYLDALQETVLEAVRLVTGEVEEVEELDVAPGEGDDVPFTPAVDVTVDTEGVETEAPAAGTSDEGDLESEPEAASDMTEPGEGEAAGTSEASEPSVASETPETAAETGDDRTAPAESGEPGEAAEPGAQSTGAAAEETDAGEAGLSDAETEVSATDATPEAGIETPDPDSDVESSAGKRGTAEDTETAEREPEPDVESASEAQTEPAEGAETSEPDDTTATADPPEEPAATDESETPEPTATGDASPETDEEAVDPGEFDLDDETRQEVEAEFGTDFSTGNEVAPAGEADIETPEPEEPETGAEPDEGGESEEPTFEAVDPDETAAEGADETASEPAEPEPEGTTHEPPAAEEETPPEPAEEDAEPAEDADLETVLLETMRDLDDGDGADREALVARVSDETGAAPDAVEDAIQDALMSGQCYEPEDGRLKPI